MFSLDRLDVLSCVARPSSRNAPFTACSDPLRVADVIIIFHALPQVLASQLLLVDEVMKAGKQMGQAPPGGPGGMMEE